MSKRSLNEEDEELQIGSYKLEAEQDVHHNSPRKKAEMESDTEVSTDSSNTSHKQLKSPHTLLKRESSGNPKISISRSLTLPENDQAEQFHRLLLEAEQSVSSRDVLIGMLQEQLKKIENLYKKSLDDSEELRSTYCVTMQDLNNLRTICEKYKEDVELLTKAQENNGNEEDLLTLQNEIDNWKSQYDNLLKEFQVMEKEVISTVSKISEEIQVDLLENPDLQNELNILNNHCISIKNCLEEQNKKLDFVVEKLQDNLEQQNKNKSGDFTNTSLNTENLEPANHPFVKVIPGCHNIKGESCDSENKVLSSNLEAEVENLKLQIEELNKKNTQLQNEIRQIDKLKEEVNKLTLLANEELRLPFFPGAPLDMKDSIVEGLKKENVHLRGELAASKHVDLSFFNSNDETSSQQESNDSSTSAHDEAKHRHASRVSFAVSDHSHPELILHSTILHHENLEHKHKMKEQEQNNINDVDKECLSVEIVNLRRQLAKKEAAMEELKQEAEIMACRKNAIINEFHNANKLLKSDYHELLEINKKLTQNLKNAGIYGPSNQASTDTLSTINTGTNTEDGYDKIETDLNNAIQLLDKDNFDKHTTEVIKEAVVESIYTEMQKLQSSLCNNAECKMILEENRKIKDELNGKTKQLETISSDLQIKTANIIEKETLIKNKMSEIEHLKKIIKDNNETINELNKSSLCNHAECNMILEENQKIKDDLNGKTKQLETISSDLKSKTANIIQKETLIKSKMSEIEHLKKIIKDNNETINELNQKQKEILECIAKTQDLQTKIDILEVKLAKALEENEKHNNDLQDHKGCKCKLQTLESTIAELEELNAKLKKENQSLKSQISSMKNTLQQYQEEADFKKLENEKLRKQEEQLQKTISSFRRNSDNIARDYHKEVETNKRKLSDITKEHNDLEKDLKAKINKLHQENLELKKLLQQKDEETKTLTDRINTITKELEQTKSLHEKHVAAYERSLCEIKDLFKNKEDQLLATIKEHEQHEEILDILDEENARLKKLLEGYMQEQENKQYGLTLKHDMELKILEDNYNNEKARNSELNKFLNNIRKETDYLKMQLQDLLQYLENKLKLLKNDISNRPCSSSISKQSINEVLDCIAQFNNNVIQQERNGTCSSCSSDETVHYSCYYEESNCRDVIKCTNQARNTHSLPPNIKICPKLSECTPTISSTTIKDLQNKKEYLLKQLEKIEGKLNNPNLVATLETETPTCTLSIASSFTSNTKSSNKESFRTCPNICETDTDAKTTTASLEYDDGVTISSCSSTTCPSWATKSEIITLTSTELYDTNDESIPKGLTCVNNLELEDESVKGFNCQKCPYSADVPEIKIVSPEPSLKTNESDDLEINDQTEPQESKLEGIEETPESEIDTDKSSGEDVPAIDAPKEENKEPVIEADTNEEKEEVDDHIRNLITQLTDDVCARYPNSSEKEILNQPLDDSKSNSSNISTPQTKKCSHTCIPVPIQNSQKKSKDKCAPTCKNIPKMNECNIKQKQSKNSDQNLNEVDLKTVHQKPTVLQSATEAKGATQPTCICLKKHSYTTCVSHVAKTSNLSNKTCICSSLNKRDKSPLPHNAQHEKNSGSKTFKQCPCKDIIENAKH